MAYVEILHAHELCWDGDLTPDVAPEPQRYEVRYLCPCGAEMFLRCPASLADVFRAWDECHLMPVEA